MLDKLKCYFNFARTSFKSSTVFISSSFFTCTCTSFHELCWFMWRCLGLYQILGIRWRVSSRGDNLPYLLFKLSYCESKLDGWYYTAMWNEATIGKYYKNMSKDSSGHLYRRVNYIVENIYIRVEYSWEYVTSDG